MRQLAIFLILCASALAQLQASDEATVCFVWHGGTGATPNAGGCTQAAYDAQAQDATDFMAPGTAAPIIAAYEVNVQSQGGVLLVDHLANTNFIDGTVAYVNFVATYTDGYYECLLVDFDSLLLVGTTWSADTTCDILVGGAIDTMQTASDAAIMNAAAYTRTCLVRGNATTALTIDIDTGGGSATTRKRFLAADASYAYSKGGCTLTTTDNLTNGVVSFGTAVAAPVITYVDLVGFIIDGGAAAGVDAEYGISCLNDNADFCSIIDCTIKDVLESPGHGIGFGGDNWQIVNTEIHTVLGCGVFCNVNDGSVNIYIGCNVHDCGTDGMFLDGAPSRVLGCRFVDNGDDGLELDDNCTNSSFVLDCTFYGNTEDGLFVDSAAQATCAIMHCASAGNDTGGGGTNYGYNLETTTNAPSQLFGYNHSNDTAKCSNTGTWATLGMGGNITGDPLFVSVVDGSEDLNYQHDSPCLGAGLGGATIGAGIHPLDYPLEADVENTVQYSNGELTGTLVGGGGGGFPVTSTIGGHIQH